MSHSAAKAIGLRNHSTIALAPATRAVVTASSTNRAQAPVRSGANRDGAGDVLGTQLARLPLLGDVEHGEYSAASNTTTTATATRIATAASAATTARAPGRDGHAGSERGDPTRAPGRAGARGTSAATTAATSAMAMSMSTLVDGLASTKIDGFPISRSRAL